MGARTFNVLTLVAMARRSIRLAGLIATVLAAAAALPAPAAAGTLSYRLGVFGPELVYTAASSEANHVDIDRSVGFGGDVFVDITESGSSTTFVPAAGPEDPTSICSVDSTAKTAFCSIEDPLNPVERILVESGDQDDIVSFAGVDETTGGATSDTWAAKSGPGADVLTGGKADDTLDGEDGNDIIDAQGGPPDFVLGGSGNDSLSGGDGLDFMTGGSGADDIQGGVDGSLDTAGYADHSAGVSVSLLSGGGGNPEDGPGDTLSQIEILVGSPFNDRLEGSNFDNTLFAEGGDDVLVGRGGADDMHGGTGFDAVSYEERSAAIVATINGTAVSGDATDGAPGPHDAIDLDVEQVIGGSGSDQIRGSDDPNTLTGGAGDDHLVGEGGNDILDGNVGHDTYADASGVDEVTFAGRTGGVAASTGDGPNDGNSLDLDGSTLEDVPAAIENLTGTNGIDTLTGSDGTNRLDGGPGGDTLRGKLGADDLRGGAGVDNASFSERSAAVAVDLDDNADDGNADDGNADNVRSDVETVIGGDGDDTLTGNPSANILDGGAGGDLIDGLQGADDLNGGTGADTLRSRDSSADEVVCGADFDSTFVDLLDNVAADCESLDKPSLPGGGPPPGDSTAPPPVGATEPPPLDTTGPPLAFAAGTLRMNARGVALVPVACGLSDPAGCSGSVVIETAAPVNVSRKRKLRLGSGRFKVAAGRRANIKVTLGRKPLSVVRRLKRLSVRVTITASDAPGNRTRLQKTYKLRYPRTR
jgi:Ca2+-binding RTX toxin-like protein